METPVYSNILDELRIERTKCKCCGEDIIYDNTEIKQSKNKLVIKGKSYQTVKVVEGVSYPLKVCQTCLQKKFPDIKIPVRSFCTMCESTKYAFDIPQDVYLRARQKYAMTKKHMIEKYGVEEGNKIWDEYCKKQAETNTYKYKKEKYGWTKEQFDEYNKSRSVTLNNLIKKHGAEEGNKIWDEYCKKQAETKSWDYMVKKYGEEKASLINKAKSQSLQACMERYGEEKGTEIYINRIEKVRNFYSDISQSFFTELDEVLSKKYTTYYATKNKEYGVNLKDSYIFLDYFIKELNLCIEFNGTNFHADPRVYDKNSHPNPFNLNITAKQIWENDKKRAQKLKEVRNIDTIVVWEIDYKKGIDIKDFIKNILKIEI